MRAVLRAALRRCAAREETHAEGLRKPSGARDRADRPVSEGRLSVDSLLGTRQRRGHGTTSETRQRRECDHPAEAILRRTPGGRAVRSRRRRSSRARFSGRPGPAGDSDDFGGARAHEAFRAVRRDLPPDARFCRERVRAAVAETCPTASVTPYLAAGESARRSVSRQARPRGRREWPELHIRNQVHPAGELPRAARCPNF